MRLVFRPASSKAKTPVAPLGGAAPPAKKRGRPRKNPDDPTAKIVSDKPDSEPEIEDPPAKTRYRTVYIQFEHRQSCVAIVCMKADGIQCSSQRPSPYERV